MRKTLAQSLCWFIISLVLTLGIFGSIGKMATVKAQLSPSTQSRIVAQVGKNQQIGNEITLNSRKFPVAWIQWQDNHTSHLGIADIGASQLFGFSLLSTSTPNQQPIQWFSANPQSNLTLKAIPTNPYRYLDVTEILKQLNAQTQINGNNLTITLAPPQITSIRQGNQPWGQRIVIDLDRPTVWQVSQAKTEGAVMLQGIPPASVLSQFQPIKSERNPSIQDEDDLGSTGSFNPSDTRLSLENQGTLTKVLLELPSASNLHVFSLANPNRLVIDIRPDAVIPREIKVSEGLTWRQQYISLGNEQFPVTWLEIDGRSPQITLKPFTQSLQTLEGIEPLVTMARSANAVAAINGGFFNRNNKLPLGAIRRDGTWISGPILNRGAIAWDNQGNISIDRLNLTETLITATGKRLPILFLNSGYVQQGIARYTAVWGSAYIPLSDNETLVWVESNRVIRQQSGGKAGSGSFSIPKDGYLLTFRKIPSELGIGTEVNLNSYTTPRQFEQYPQIVGAGPLLLQQGRIVLNAAAENFSTAFIQQKASRSAIATQKDGKIMMLAVHNRVGGQGASLAEFAQILQKMGAIDALNLDGGSSTSLALGGQLIDRFPVTAARVHNGIGVFFREK